MQIPTGNPVPHSTLQRAADAIRAGGLVAFPTDTFFALGANAMAATAVERVFTVKGRNPGTPVPVLISDFAMAEQLVSRFPSPLRDLAEHFWPGALTIVLPASEVVPGVVAAGTGTVGLRVPDHDLARALIAASNTPLTGTSCNVSGGLPIKDPEIVRQQFGDKISVVIAAPCGDNTLPSTVIGLADSAGGASQGDNTVRMLRAGAIDIDSLRKVVGDIIFE